MVIIHQLELDETSIGLEPNPETLAKALALVSDHVDLLLEDWYPSLGTRFVHTSEGRCLITRLVPCPLCLRDAENAENVDNADNIHHARNVDHAGNVDHAEHVEHAEQALALELDGGIRRLSEESRASDRDSGVGAESNASSRMGSVEGRVDMVAGGGGANGSGGTLCCAWALEECILCACTGTAPLLLDVEEDKRARWEDITRTCVAGRGAFGTVLAGVWRRGGRGEQIPVAVKALQPVPPPPASDISQHQAYKGALDGVLRQYRGCGARVSERVVRALALQLAKALEYLHAARVLYRDLKVSISRMAPPSGTKGFGGTEGFMAPEIMRYNGEEEYNEKVDCFSYGMVLYEMISLRQPFEGHEAVKEAVLEGARPALTNRVR
ncbi:unnamed protein product [Diatraea saccharalis]|uniref:Protein kinase domain-containing protein n=1 Tax=Diatraea saccharalis TaxID=40085 RepID=A0A9N9WEP5_9NEOP|nr:unnamed protein product [Diatraea saccharalis]